MKKKGLVLLLLVFLVMAISVSVMAEEVLVPITKLGLAPWLGQIKDENDLANKFAREKAYFAGYIQYDLKEAAKLEITLAEANGIVNSMESAMKGVKETSVPDETVFKSMGWKSKKGQVMRTKNPILKLGKTTKGFSVKVDFKDYEIEYVFLKDCGNLCLQDVKAEIPPKAEYVPRPKEEETLPPKKEQPRVQAPPSPPPAEPPTPPPSIYYSYNYYQQPSAPPEDYAYYGAGLSWMPFVYNGINYYGWFQSGWPLPIPVYYDTGRSWCFMPRHSREHHFRHGHHEFRREIHPPKVRTLGPETRPPGVRTIGTAAERSQTQSSASRDGSFFDRSTSRQTPSTRTTDRGNYQASSQPRSNFSGRDFSGGRSGGGHSGGSRSGRAR